MILFKKFSVIKLRTLTTQHAFIEMIVIFTTILLAAALGNYIALLVTRQMTDMLTRFIVGIVVGLVVGMLVGILVNRTWEKTQILFRKWKNNENTL